MSLKDQVRRWWPVPVLGFVGIAGGAAYSVVTPVQYSASAFVVTTTASSSTTATSPAQGDTQLALGFAQAYARIAGQGGILAPAADSTGRSADWLRSHVQSSSSPNAPIIQITGTAPSAAEAASVANAVAKSLAAYGSEHSQQTNVDVSVFSEATPPDQPATPGTVLELAVGGIAGALLGLFTVLSRNPARTWSSAAAPSSPATTAASASAAAAGQAPAPVATSSSRKEPSGADVLEQLFAADKES